MSGPILWTTGVLVVYLVGILNWRRAKLHRTMMVCGICCDVVFTLYLEITRGVVGQTVSGDHQINGYLLAVHILLSFAVFYHYFITWRSARRYRSGAPLERGELFRKHSRLGYRTLAFYIGSWATAPGWIIERMFF